MKALFIEPPGRYLRTMGSLGEMKGDFLWQPLDHLVIAGFLLNSEYNNFEVRDLRTDSFATLENTIGEIKPDIIFFNSCVTSLYNDLKVAEIAKKIDKNIKVGIFGTIVTALKEEVFRLSKYIDMAIVDPEPEIAIRQILIKGINKVKSGVYVKRGKKIYKFGFSRKIENLDELGLTAHGEVDNEKYYDLFMKRKNFALVYGSRGCRWGKCIFCSCPNFYQPLRLRSVKMIINELKWINSEFGVRDVKWWDAEINCNLIWCKKLFKAMIKENLDITFQANFRADLYDKELLKLMKRAGCYHLEIGLESADLNILKNIKKGITPKMVEKAAKYLKEMGIDFSLYSLCGLPGETKETLEKTREFVKSLNCPSTFGIAVPNPGTEFYYYCLNNNYLKNATYDNYDTTKPPVFDYPNLSSEEIYKECKKSYKSLAFSPLAFKLLCKNPKKILSYIKTGIKVIR